MPLLARFLVVFLLLLGIAGCGGSTDQSGAIAAPQPAEQTPVGVGEPAEAAAATVEPVPTAEVSTPEREATTPELAATATPEPVVIEPVVFNDDFATSIAPIFAENCASCHNAGGPGATHWQLEQAGDLVATHDWIAGVVGAGYMPPWPASDLSLLFHDNRSLRADEIAAITQWSAAGAPLDVEATAAIAAPGGLARLAADIEIGPHEPFQGSSAVADDYRCLIYDLELDEPQWLQGFEFVPDQTQIVHHAIGYLAPASDMAQAQLLSDRDGLGGWQCYGGSGLSSDDLFLGWAPGQLPTAFPAGSGLLVEPGDFIVLQIHYHFDTAEAPEDASTIRLDWADGKDLDQIDFDEFIGPAEIPCSTSESGPLCDRDAALERAYETYGVEGVLADGINRICAARPEDFAGMTDGVASSTCRIPIRNYGEIVSVFGHEHEIGRSFRMTLNAGQPDERILLDIPDWSFDWQLNYYPSESIMLRPGDNVLLECSWDRSRRSPDLEPAYVLWADGTNDEMCFATIATRRISVDGTESGENEPAPDGAADLSFALPADIRSCLSEIGVPSDRPPMRDEIDATVDALFTCAEPQDIGVALTGVIADNFRGLVSVDGLACLADGLSSRDAARSLLAFTLNDASDQERLPVAELVGDCVSLSDALAEFGFPLPDSTQACIDEVGRALLVQATLDGELPEEQTLFGAINPCLAGD